MASGSACSRASRRSRRSPRVHRGWAVRIGGRREPAIPRPGRTATIDRRRPGRRARLVTPHQSPDARHPAGPRPAFDSPRRRSGRSSRRVRSRQGSPDALAGPGHVGKRVLLRRLAGETEWRPVVGIADDMRSLGLGGAAFAELSFPRGGLDCSAFGHPRRPDRRTTRLPRPDAPAVKAGRPACRLRPATMRWMEAPGAPRGPEGALRHASCFAALGAHGLFLVAGRASAGWWSSFVAGDRREFGVRMALGATARDIFPGHRATRSAAPVLFGLLAGVAAALAAARLLRPPSAASARTTLTFCAVVLVLAAVAALATYIPARRATRIDPSAALRNE